MRDAQTMRAAPLRRERAQRRERPLRAGRAHGGGGR